MLNDKHSHLAEEPIADSEMPPSITSLISGIVSDVEALLHQQLSLFRHEMQHGLQTTCESIGLMGIGVGSLLVGAIGLLLAIANWLSSMFPNLPLWGSFALLGSIFSAIGCGLLYRSAKPFEFLHSLPDESDTTLKEQNNAQ